MLIDSTDEYNLIWDKVYDTLKFSPSCVYHGHSFNVPLPFQINEDHSVYGVDKMTDTNFALLDDMIRQIFINITESGQKIYALDWMHSAFLYDPRNLSEQQSFIQKYQDGEYLADFPAFYPDGDYYFFIDENFRFGYLGHPWRQEVWVFGKDLIKEIENIYEKLGWTKLK